MFHVTEVFANIASNWISIFQHSEVSAILSRISNELQTFKMADRLLRMSGPLSRPAGMTEVPEHRRIESWVKSSWGLNLEEPVFV